MPPQGMSAEDSLVSRLTGCVNIMTFIAWMKEHPTVGDLVKLLAKVEAAARADERVISEKDLAELKCCPKCRFEIEAMHSRDLRAQSYAGEVVKRAEASQERVRVKAWKLGYVCGVEKTKEILLEADLIHRYQDHPDGLTIVVSGLIETDVVRGIRVNVEDLKVPEAQPVEPVCRVCSGSRTTGSGLWPPEQCEACAGTGVEMTQPVEPTKEEKV